MNKQESLDMFAAALFPWCIETAEPNETLEQSGDIAYSFACALYNSRKRYMKLKPGQMIVRKGK